jgi:hypothetical protein
MDDVPAFRNEALSATATGAVYQCANGCVHVRLRQVTLTFSACEFAELVELLGEAYVRLCVRTAGATSVATRS